MRRINQLKLVLASMLTAALLFGAAPLAFAGTQSQADACAGLAQLDSSANCNSSASANGVSHLIATVINILSIIVGAAAVLMVILGGFRYITSGGDAGNTASARNTIIYALIGLVLVAFAQVLVHFVLAKAK